jgi:nucleoside-diphosphate-sugar epimerase
MAALVTGGSGFLGKALIKKLQGKGKRIYCLSRHPIGGENIVPLTGDITQPNLGLKKVPEDIAAIYHLAAIHRLGDNQADEIWETNIGGTANVIEFCEKYEIPHLLFVSSAYTFARNSYEKSKMVCESLVMNSHIPKKTIFKPSVIMPTKEQVYPGHFLQFVGLLVKIHKRAETIRRYLESKLRLPVLRPVFRIPGNPDGYLNLVGVEDVAKAMVEIKKSGIFWLCHPSPPILQQLATWIGEVILLDIKIEPQFEATPLELTFQKLGAAFLPYVWGDSFKSDIEAAPIDREFVQQAILNYLLTA